MTNEKRLAGDDEVNHAIYREEGSSYRQLKERLKEGACLPWVRCREEAYMAGVE